MKKHQLIFNAIGLLLVFGSLQTLAVTEPSQQALNNRQIINHYKNISLNGFVRLRFTGFYAFQGSNLAPEGATENERSLNQYYVLGKPLENGSYVNYAPYNAEHIQFLIKPQQEIAQYCQIKGGTLRPVQFYTKDIVQKGYLNPVSAYLSAKSSLSQLTYDIGGNRAIKLSPAAVEHLARKEYYRTQELNHQHDIIGSLKGYMRAMKQGAFGKFACVSPDTQKPKWSVSITPILYKPSSSAQNAHEVLYIAINPLA